MGALKAPHGGELKNLYLDEAGVRAEKARARDLPSWDLTMRQLCDIEMLLNGAFSPLDGFMAEPDYRRVLAEMRLTSGVLWPMPITLDVTPAFAEKLEEGDAVALRDGEGVLDRDARDLEHLPTGSRGRSPGRVRHDGRAAPRRHLPAPPQQRGVPRRYAAGRRGARPLRFQALTRYS